jgi:hypothetical protein
MEQELEVGLISRRWNRSWEYIGLTFRAGTRSGELYCLAEDGTGAGSRIY